MTELLMLSMELLLKLVRSDTKSPDLNRILTLTADHIADVDNNQVVADFFPLASYLPLKAYDRFLQPFYETHLITCKLPRERKETHFDPKAPVEDVMSAFLRAERDLDVECEKNEAKAAHVCEDHFVVSIEAMFLAGNETTSTATVEIHHRLLN